MFLIDVPTIAYKTLSITILRKTEDGYEKDYDLEEKMAERLKKSYPYEQEHQHI